MSGSGVGAGSHGGDVADSRMKNPRSGAAAAGGDVEDDGHGEATIFSMMSRVESTRPPGVLISMRTA